MPAIPACAFCKEPHGSLGFRNWRPTLGWHTECLNCRLWRTSRTATQITAAQAQAANA